jgi:hypothetical protein
LTIQGCIHIQVDGASGPAQAWETAVDLFIDTLYRRVRVSMQNQAGSPA